MLALRSQEAGKILRMVATVLAEPASENGQKGMDELHEQTVNLLSFQELRFHGMKVASGEDAASHAAPITSETN